MPGGRIETIGPYELRHPDTFPAITEDPYHLVDFLLNSYRIDQTSSIIDIGTATGVIPLLLASKGYLGRITGVEVDVLTTRCAKENVESNKLGERVEIINLDYRELPDKYESASFDIVVSNPPYIKAGHGKMSDNKRRRIARYEELGCLKELISTSKYLLKPGGRLFLIFPERRSGELTAELESAGFSIVRKETPPGNKSRAKHFMVEGRR